MKKDVLILALGVTTRFTVQHLRRPRVDLESLSPWIVHATDANLPTLLEQGGEWVLLDFWSPSCGPCVRMKPELSGIAPLYKDKVTFLSLQVVENASAGSFYGIRAIPALVLLRNGTEVDRRLGYHSNVQLQQWLDEHVLGG